MAPAILGKLGEELGFLTFLHSTRDCKILCLLRFVRMFAYGSSTLVLALFLAELDITVASIGLFMTLTLLGDVLLSFFLTIFADGVGRRIILTTGALLMTASGLCFSLSSSWWVLVVASVFGVISPSGSEIGPFRAIEESTLAQLTPKEVRSDVFAWYALIGSAGAAIGTLTSGVMVEALNVREGWTLAGSYRFIFVLYSILGLIKAALTLLLSDACEAERIADKAAYHELQQHGADEDEDIPLEADLDGEEESTPNGTSTLPRPVKKSVYSRIVALLPEISSTSFSILWKLCLLFAVDSFASGLVPPSWLSYYFTIKFSLPAEVLGTIFFVTNLVASASGLAASSLARRIGLVKTMVFTHLPSAIFLALIPVPSRAGLSVTFLILRSCTASMDSAPRQAFLAEAVLPSERTAVMGVVNVIKTLAQSGGPSVTGQLAGRNRFWVVFLVAGGLKASYDLSLLTLFLGFKGREGSS